MQNVDGGTVLRVAEGLFVAIVGALIVNYIVKSCGSDEGGDIGCKEVSGINLVKVPRKDYSVPGKYRPWTVLGGAYTVQIKKDFHIMDRELTVGNVNSLFGRGARKLLDHWPEGSRWLEGPADSPVQNVSEAAIVEIAGKLSDISGCTYELPTHDQWLAALSVFGDGDPVFGEEDPASDALQTRTGPPDGRTVHDLLGNLREWVRDAPGSDGICLVGEDYRTPRSKAADEPICNKAPYELGGIRLVRRE